MTACLFVLSCRGGDHHMPCRYDPTPEEIAQERRREREAWARPLREEIDRLRGELGRRESMLCAVLTVLDDGFESHGTTFYLGAVLDRVDWQEAGVTRRETEEWWQDHLERDRERRHQEALARERRRQEILARLTPEERELLGLEG